MGQAPSAIDSKGKPLPKDYIYDKDGTTLLKRTISGQYEPVEPIVESQLNWTLDEKITEQRALGKRSVSKDSDSPAEKKFHFGRETKGLKRLSKSNNSPKVPSTPSPVSGQKVPQRKSSVYDSP